MAKKNCQRRSKGIIDMGEYLLLQDDIRMLREFVGESSENLRDIRQRLQKLETTEDATADLNEVIRCVHTMKCVSSFAGITAVTALSHQIETVLACLRSGEVKIDPALVALLLGSCDALGGMLICLKQACEKHSSGDLTLVLASSEQIETIKSELVGVMNKQEVPGEQEPRVPTTQGGSVADDALMAAIQQQDAGEVMDSFLTEADEHVDMVADQLLIRLSGNDQDADALADLFRRIHTIKGLLGVVLSLDTAETPERDLVKELQSVFHSVESSLEKIRQGEILISERLINLCYAAVDGLRRFSQCMRRGGRASRSRNIV